MDIKKITQGITGQEAADIIFNNDILTAGASANITGGANNDTINTVLKLISRIWLQHPTIDLSLYDFRIDYVSYNTYSASNLSLQLWQKLKSATTFTLIGDINIPFPIWKKGVRLSYTRSTGAFAGMIVTVVTSDEEIGASFPNTFVSVYLTSGAVLDAATTPAVLNELSDHNRELTDLQGKRVSNYSMTNGTKTSSTNPCVDDTMIISAYGKLLSISVNIATVSSTQPNVIFYVASIDQNFNRFTIKQVITKTPVAGRNTYDVSDLNITLEPGDCIIWGGAHTIRYSSIGTDKVTGRILSGTGVTPYNVGDVITSNTLYGYNFNIQIGQDVDYNKTFLWLRNQIPNKTYVSGNSSNLFNYDDRVVGYLVTSDGSLGPILSNPNVWFTMGYVDVREAANIIVHRGGDSSSVYSLAFYNQNKQFIAGSYQFAFDTGFNGRLTVPDGAVYFRATVYNTTGWQVNKGSDIIPYEDYREGYYLSDKATDNKDWKFKPDTNGETEIDTELFTPTTIYTVCNDITQDEAAARNYAVALFLDHLVELTGYAPLRFAQSNSDNFAVYSKFTSYGVLPGGGRGWIWNEDGSMIKITSKEVQVLGVKDSPTFSFNQVSTRNTATRTGYPKVLCIGDSVTEGYLANINRPYSNSPTAYWQWAKAFFDFDKAEGGGDNYKSLFVGQRNVVNFTAKYNDTDISTRACAEGKGAALLSQYLRSTTIGGATNYFYDVSKTTTNKFSVLYWLGLFRTMDDAGVRLTGSAGQTVTGSDGKTYTIGTNVTNTSAYDVCTPSHVVIQLGYNDGDRAGYAEDMAAMMDIIQSEIPGCKVAFSLPDCPGTYFPELYPEYGRDVSDMYPVSYLYGAAQSSHVTFRNMNKKLIALDAPDNERYYLPTYFIGPTARSAPYHFNNFASWVSSGGLKDVLNVQGWAAPNLHPNNYAHAAWGYEVYAWIKYTLAK